MANHITLPNAKQLAWLFALLAVLSAAAAFWQYQRIGEIRAFNLAAQEGKSPTTDRGSIEAKFNTAYWLAKNERYKEASQIFAPLLENATISQQSAIQYNIGNIFFRRGLAIDGSNNKVKNEAEYLYVQAKNAYQKSLKLEHNHWDAKHNLDRVLSILPEHPTPGVGGDTPGLIMGTIPVGLP